MSYTVETINNCTKKLVFNFETLDLSTQIKTEIQKKQKTVSIKGFRKGKAPLSLVEQVYGSQIENEALNSFIQSEFFQAVTKENLKVVGYPTFENMNYKKDDSVSFDALVETFPEFELEDYSNLEFSRDEVKLGETELEDLKKNYLNSKAEMKELEGASLENGHHAVFDFEGTRADGSKPENMKGKEYVLEIGSGQFIPGFEENMMGMKTGEEKDLELTFPKDYHMEDLRDEKVTFHVKLHEIKEKVFPEFSDEMAKEFGFDSVKDFETKQENILMNQKNRAADEKLHGEILEKLIGMNKFDVPKTMITQQEGYLRSDLEKSLKQQGFNEEMMKEYFAKWSADVSSKAEFQVKSGLILEKLGAKYSVESTDADFDKKIEEMASQTGMEVDKVKEYYSSNDQVKKNMMYAIKEEKTFEALKSDIKIK